MGAPSGAAHWMERRWARLLRGGRGRPLGLLLLAVLVVLVWLPETPGLQVLRLACFDTYQSRAPRVRRSDSVVIVAIDDESLKRLGQWPWPRTRLARLVSRISDAHPAAIGLDILMPEYDRLSPGRLGELVEGLDADLAQKLAAMASNDAVLARALRGRPVVLGVAGADGGDATPGAVGSAPVRAFGADPAPFLPRFSTGVGSVPEIDGAAMGRGLVSVDAERGVVRRVPLLAVVGGTVMPTLALEMLRVAARVPAVTVRVGARGMLVAAVGDLVVPTERDSRVWLHYSHHDPARFVSAADVLAGLVEAERFQGRLVLIGANALGLSDAQGTPVADQMSGVEIHAQLLEGLVEGSLLSRPTLVHWIEIVGLSLGGLLLLAAVPRLRARRSVALLLLLIGTFVALGVLGYLGRGVLFDAATPSLALAVLFTVMLALTLTEAESQRRALRRQIEQQREAAARLAGELEAARRIQMGTLPRPAVAFPGETRFDLYALLEPAREVGGDLYDFFYLDPDHLFFMIGDVSGKGLPGSLFMAISKALYKSTALRRHGQVAAMMREADAEISRDNGEGLFVTVLAGILDARTGDLEYCIAGHEPPYLLPRGARLLSRLDEGGGPPLCAVDGFPYTAAGRRLEPGDTLCLITDGITEAASPSGELYGRARLEALLGRLGSLTSAAEVAETIRGDVAGFTGSAEPSDDIAVLILRFAGTASVSGAHSAAIAHSAIER
ncbi:MAG TPA: CHASE2 domain-containing protein [Candidatus Dormibacteraeota bacterium]|nr:CHASE2 domain-containing protein [Candidatus Dormibacteraeota bacterium]